MYVQDLSSFEQFLKDDGLMESSINIYIRVVKSFLNRYDEPTQANLHSFRSWLIANYSPKTANLRINAINRWLKFCGLYSLTLKSVKIQRAAFFDEGVTLGDYQILKDYLKRQGEWRDYFAVWTMTATGVRVSELLQLTVQGMESSIFDVVGKGGKIRRVLIPTQLSCDATQWFEDENRSDGYAFLNKYGRVISVRGLSQRLKEHALSCGINPESVHPHAFRHAFARAFLDAGGDISLLADLMGHSSIETTRIYLRRGAAEQRAFVDKVVTW